MSEDRTVPARIRVAFQGELGAFSEEAVHRFFGEGVVPVPRRDFSEVGRAVVERDVDFGLLPIENTLAGSVVGSYDVLAGGELRILGEVITPIHHCVLGLPGASLQSLKRILSHPVALMQCTRFLRALPGVDAVAVYDTAGAAKDIAAQADPTQAAIAARRAAGRYGLDLLAEDVEDRPDNQTRFLVVTPRDGGKSLPPHLDRQRNSAKSAVLVETANQPGALLQILSPFSERSINLSKLESRPAGEPWTYRFFIEFDADAGSPAAEQALAEIHARAVNLQVLGTYPRWED
ncbi:MAG: prephenate dehydratase [Gemmatimonadota bacterium]